MTVGARTQQRVRSEGGSKGSSCASEGDQHLGQLTDQLALLYFELSDANAAVKTKRQNWGLHEHADCANIIVAVKRRDVTVELVNTQTKVDKLLSPCMIPNPPVYWNVNLPWHHKGRS